MPAPHHFRFHHQAIVENIVRLHLSFRNKRRGGNRPRQKGDDIEYEPVEPPRPTRPLTGGAAAELEFDD